MYIVKSLPIEGEIKVGDRVKNNLNEIGTVTKIRNLPWGFNYEVTAEMDFVFTLKNQTYEARKQDLTKLGKLFLCSTDIQVGDKFTYDGSFEETILEIIGDEIRFEDTKNTMQCGVNARFYWSKKGLFKVIGEISPDAKWVREGDELTEDEVTGNFIFFNAFGESSSYYKSLDKVSSYKLYSKDDFGSKRGMYFRNIIIKCPHCETFK